MLLCARFSITVTAALAAMTFAVAEVLDRAFDSVVQLGGVLFSENTMFESPARSTIDCGRICSSTFCCVSFTHVRWNSTRGTCRGHRGPLTTASPGMPAQGAQTFLWSGEKQITGTTSNVAVGKSASQSSTYPPNAQASRAVDNNLDTNFRNNACTHTNDDTPSSSWWQVDLGASYDIVSVKVTNRGDCADCALRLRDFDIHVYNDNPVDHPAAPSTLCRHYDGPMGAAVTEDLRCCYAPITGQFVRITNTPNERLTLCEVQVMAVKTVEVDHS